MDRNRCVVLCAALRRLLRAIARPTWTVPLNQSVPAVDFPVLYIFLPRVLPRAEKRDEATVRLAV